MKFLVAALILTSSVALAQTQTITVDQLKQQYDSTVADAKLNYQILQGLSEFQAYLTDLKEIQELEGEAKKLQAPLSKTVAPAKVAAPTPAK